MTNIPANDKHILQELARKQLEFFYSPKNQENIRHWYLNNACKGERPMVHIELGTFWPEIVPPRLVCQSEAGRKLEAELHNNMVNLELFDDDKPVPGFFPVRVHAHFLPFGIQPQRTVADEGLGFHVEPAIRDLEQDFHLLGEPEMPAGPFYDTQLMDLAQDTFGKILPARLRHGSINSYPSSAILGLMGMETMFISMYDYPDLFHKMMDRYANDTLRLYDHMEKEGIVLPTTDGMVLSHGSFCYTDELPQNASKVKQVWGHMNCQEATGMSQDMFAEFMFPYYKKIADRFALLSYGCCEAVHPQWESLKTLGNLRKISISPWCDEEFMGSELRGTNIVYHRKPPPHYIGVGTVLDEDAVRADIRRTVKAARGCTLEISQRDVYSVNHDVEKVRRYVEIIREECSRHER